MADTHSERMLEALYAFQARFSSNNRIHIDPVAGFIKASGFFLYVGTEGNVRYTDMSGNVGIEKFVVGYHPTMFIRVWENSNGTSASDMAACF